MTRIRLWQVVAAAALVFAFGAWCAAVGPGAGPRPGAPAHDADAVIQAAARAIAHGQYAQAEAIAHGQVPAPAAAVVIARLAIARGRYDEAATLLQPVAAANSTSEAALEWGLLLETRGRAADARRVLEPIASQADTVRTPAGLLRAARASRAIGQFGVANSIFADADAAAKGDPAINTEWGDLLLQRHEPAEAVHSYQIALERDASWAPAHLGLARAAADDDNAEASASAKRALQIDPSLVGAHLVLAGIALEEDHRGEAIDAINRALAVNFQSPEAHALLAGIALLDGRTTNFEAERMKAFAVNPTYGDVYRTAAWLAAGNNRFDEAISLARQALAIEPDNVRAQAELGMHLMRAGDEIEARRVLEQAWAADQSNPITKNLLDLLDHLAPFKSFNAAAAAGAVPAPETVVRLDPAEAPVLQYYAIPIVEQALAKYGERYHVTPHGPVLVEIFPRHDDFAVRTQALPGLVGALGATFGHVVTLDSPRARDPGTFNWQATLWHELAHVFTLAASNQRVPRWLTEGLSVWEEGRVRHEWAEDSEMGFARAYAEGHVLKLADLNGGFMRPDLIGLAYYEASLVVEMIVDRSGDQGLRALLGAYGAGLDTDSALQKALGVRMADLQATFDTRLEQRFGALGRVLQMPKGVEIPPGADAPTLQALAARYPDSYPLQMAAGRALAASGAKETAFAMFERAARLAPTVTGADSPHARMADLAEQAGDAGRALAELKALMAYDHTNVSAARKLAALADKAGDEAGRLLAYDRIVTVDPFDAAAHTAYGRIALGRRDLPLALRELQAALAAGPIDVVSAHCDLADAFLAANRRDEAKREVLAALKIAPSYPRGQDLLLKIVEGK
jgi:tetratricopeptide (TPR) repeat protein